MTWTDFIFSNNTIHRAARHLVFWVTYCFYFWVQSFAPKKFAEFFTSDTYYFAFLNLCCFSPVFIFLVYFFIYFLLPRTLQKKKYALFILGFILLYVTGTFINYFTAGLFLNNVHYSVPIEPNFQHRLEFGNYNTRWGMIIATVALGIKLSKNLYLQQKENQLMQRQKIRANMQFHKSRIHPGLLFRSLDAIQERINNDSGDPAGMILNLSDLLSYSLYESETEWVPLENELSGMKHLIELEQLNMNNSFEMKIKTGGDLNNQLIAPLVLVKLLEECIILLHSTENLSSFLGLEIIVTRDRLSCNLSFGDFPDAPSFLFKWPVLIHNTNLRLKEYYSDGDFELDLKQENRQSSIILNLKLYGDVKKSIADRPVVFNTAHYDPA